MKSSATIARPRAKSKAPRFAFGELRGRIPVDSGVAAAAAQCAKDYWEAESKNDFNGDDVAVELVPSWAPALKAWWPTESLMALGFKRSTRKASQDLIITLGVDEHVDRVSGPTLCYVLHNDGLLFKQGRARHVPAAGDWFVFDDYAVHEVRSADGPSVFVALTVPLEVVDHG